MPVLPSLGCVLPRRMSACWWITFPPFPSAWLVYTVWNIPIDANAAKLDLLSAVLGGRLPMNWTGGVLYTVMDPTPQGSIRQIVWSPFFLREVLCGSSQARSYLSTPLYVCACNSFRLFFIHTNPGNTEQTVHYAICKDLIRSKRVLISKNINRVS